MQNTLDLLRRPSHLIPTTVRGILNSYITAVSFKNQGLGPYSKSIKTVQDDINKITKNINEVCGIKESDTGLALPSQWDLVADKQMLQEEQPLLVRFSLSTPNIKSKHLSSCTVQTVYVSQTMLSCVLFYACPLVRPTNRLLAVQRSFKVGRTKAERMRQNI